MTDNQRRSTLWLGLALVVGLILSLIYQLPTIADPYLVDEDLRFLYWINRYADPQLFQVDPVYGFQMAQLNLGLATILINKVHLVYSLIFALLGRVVSPIILSQVLVFPLILISIWFLFRIGQRIFSPLMAFILCLLFIILTVPPHSAMSLTTGLPRSFTLPLLLALLYFLLNKNYKAGAVVLFLSVSYPPIFLLAGTTYGLSIVVPSIRQRSLVIDRSELAFLLVAFVAGALVLLPATTTGLVVAPDASSQFPEHTIYDSPMHKENGRYPLLSPRAISANGGIVDSGTLGIFTLLLMVLALLSWIVLRSQANRLPSAFWYLFLASWLCWAVSWLPIIFTSSAFLHLPSRYPRGTLFLLALVFVVANGPIAMQVGARQIVRHRSTLVWVLAVVGLICTGIVFAMHGSSRVGWVSAGLTLVLWILSLYSWQRGKQAGQGVATDVPAQPQDPKLGLVVATAILILLPMVFLTSLFQGRPLRSSGSMLALLGYLETLPKDVLIGGNPCSLDEVALFAERSVLFSCEVEHRSWDLMLAAVSAYYAETAGEILDFCREHGVDYLVADTGTFSAKYIQEGHFMYEPIDSQVSKLLEDRSSFVLDDIPESLRSFQAGSLYVIPCQADALEFGG